MRPQIDTFQSSTSRCSEVRLATGMVVSALITSFAATSSGRNSRLPFLPSEGVVRPSTARLRYGNTSSSTMSSRNTASGSKASFDRMMQSSNEGSLLIVLHPTDLNGLCYAFPLRRSVSRLTGRENTPAFSWFFSLLQTKKRLRQDYVEHICATLCSNKSAIFSFRRKAINHYF